MLEKRVCDQKESEYEQKKDGVLERKYNDGRSGDMGRRKNTEMKYVETLKKTVLIFGCALFVNILFWSGQRMRPPARHRRRSAAFSCIGEQ